MLSEPERNFLNSLCLFMGDSRLQHADFLRIREDAPRVDDRRHLAEWLQLPGLLRRDVGQYAGTDVDLQLVAGADVLAQTIRGLERNDVAAVDGVAEEDASIELGNDALDAG